MTNYNDGNWHGWNGGECPVHPKSVVDVRLDGDIPNDPQEAEKWEWPHEGDIRDIIAFRVITPWVEPKPETGTLAELNVKPGDVVRWGNGHYVVQPFGRANPYGEMEIWAENKIGWLRGKDFEEVITRAVEPKPETEPLPYGHVRLSDGSVFDMTAERQPAFGMLTEEEQAALQVHGGPYQYWDCKWEDFDPSWRDNGAYRVKPQPVRVTVTRDMWGDERGHLLPWENSNHIPVTVTYQTVNGVPDYSTYRVKVE